MENCYNPHNVSIIFALKSIFITLCNSKRFKGSTVLVEKGKGKFLVTRIAHQSQRELCESFEEVKYSLLDGKCGFLAFRICSYLTTFWILSLIVLTAVF